MSKKTLKRILCILMAVSTTALTGCSGVTGFVPGKYFVERVVEVQCPTEQIEWYDTETHLEFPGKVTYHIRSKERDLSFDAVSTLENLSMFRQGDTPIYIPTIDVGYTDAVKDIYNDTYLQAKQNITFGGNTVYFYDESYFPQIAQDIVMLSDIYAPEREYNTDEWMDEHPIGVIAVVWNSDMENPGKGEHVITERIYINGCLTYDEVLEEITEAYNEKLEEGDIPKH